MPLKKKKKVVIDEPALNLEPLNAFEPLSMSQEQHGTPPPYSSPKEPGHYIWDSRKGKGILNNLTTNMDRIDLYRGLAPE